MTRRGGKAAFTPALSVITMSVSLFLTAGSIVWGASKIDSRVADIEKWIVANADTQIKLIEAKNRSEVLEANQITIMKHLDEIDRKIEKKR